MTSYHRLGIVAGFLGVFGAITWAHVRGDGSKKASLGIANGSISGKIERLEEDLAHSKFSEKRILTYKKQDGQQLFALQVQPKLEAAAARPRDYLLMVDTSASQGGLPMAFVKKFADQFVERANPTDRISNWTLNT